jgi:hypothetical protein
VTALIVDTRHGERNWRTPPCCITGRFSEPFDGCSNPGRTILIGEREVKDRANGPAPVSPKHNADLGGGAVVAF